MKKVDIFLAIIALFFIINLSFVSAWDNLLGGDHGGADWIISSNTQISGIHTNVKDFKINSGVYVILAPFNGASNSASYGSLEIHARNITIDGTLDASGAGYGGGGGGGGGASDSGWSGSQQKIGGSGGSGIAWGQNGISGSNSLHYASQGGNGGNGGGWGPGIRGIGGYVAGYPVHGNGGSNGGNGGYLASGINGDYSTDESLVMGSGGGGGGGSSGAAAEDVSDSAGGGAGGGAGARGSGFIKLYALNRISVSGNILSRGGTSAGDGAAGVSGCNVCDFMGSGVAGGNAASAGTRSGGTGGNSGCYGTSIGRCGTHPTNYNYFGGNGGNGGVGAGGGILIYAMNINITGTIDNRGGGNNLANGGTLKIFCGSGTKIMNTAVLQSTTGRLYQDNSCTSICTSTPEICDGIDNNCNGLVDENLFNYGACNQVGACFGSRQTCISGSWSSCSIVPQPEILDGIDNNCNGIIDDGFNPPIINIISPISGQTYNLSTLLLEVLTNEAVNNCRYDLDGAGYVAMTSLNSTHFRNLINLLGDGNHIIAVNCTDTDGMSTLTSLNFASDTTPPAINIISPTSLFYSSQTQYINITSDATAQAIWYNWNGTNVIYTAPEQVVFSEGWNNITAYVNDSYGNINSANVPFFYIDSADPIVTITNPASDNLWFGADNIPIDYNVIETNLVSCWWTNNSGAINHTITCGDNITGQTWAEGANVVTVSAEDIIGHVSSATRLFNIDNSAPVINIITPTAGGIFSGDVFLSASITDSNLDLSSLRYEIRENSAGGIINASGALSGAGAAYNASFLTDNAWPRMNLTLIVYASDIYGRNSTASRDFFLDNSVPSITFINPAGDNSSIFSNNFNLDVLVQGYLLNETSYQIDDSLGNTVTSNIATLSQASFSWNDFINISGLADGIYNLKVSARDSSTPAEIVNALTYFIIDRTSPAIISVFPNEGGLYNYSCIDVNLTFDSGTAWFVWNGTTYALPQPICTNFNEGSNTIEIYANDTAGNINNQNTTFIVDTVAPDIQFVEPTETDNSRINRNNLQIGALASDSNSGIALTTVEYYDIANNQIYTITNTSDNIRVDAEGLADGIYTFKAYARDNVGNMVYTETRTVTIDTVAPIITLVSPVTYLNGVGTPTFMSNSSQVYLEVLGNENLDSCYYYPGGVSHMMTRTSPTNFNALTSSLPDITAYSAIFVCNDTAGNLGASENFEILIDLTAPEISINSPLNQTYPTRNILVNITSAVDSGVLNMYLMFYQPETMWYNWNGTNVYVSGGNINDRLTSILENVRFNRWSNTLTAYVNDTAGNMNTQSVTFFVDLPVTIMDSKIYGTYYPYNVSEDVVNINFADSFVGNSTIEGVIPVDVVISNIMRSNLTNLILIYNCTAIDANFYGGSCQISAVISSDISDSNLTEVQVANSTISNSTIFNSTIIDAEVTNSNVDNSYIENSIIADSIVVNASISNGILYCGNLTFDGLPMVVSDCINPINLTDIINYPPNARLFNPASANVGDLVLFDGSLSTDPNLAGLNLLNDSLNYTFDFGDGTPLITTNLSSISHAYASAGNYTVNLIVTDSFGASDSDMGNIVINSAGSFSGSGSSGGGGTPTTRAPSYLAGPGNKVYWPTGEQLAAGYTVSMRLREVIKFFVEYKLYYFETINISNRVLDAEVRWPQKPLSFNIGGAKNIDVNDDGHDDVNIRLNSIANNGTDYFASVTIKRLFKEGQTPESDVPPGTVFSEAQTASKTLMQTLLANWMLSAAILLALVALISGIVYYAIKEKKERISAKNNLNRRNKSATFMLQ